jgi:diaminohydroxyphosphoribosylaminopyrimidine deaminase/5-amino-6-(5-phosphoribosylamino)uracil reductase
MTPAADARYMRVALRLARRGVGRTSPNPPVGAVVVRRGKIVGRGYHRRAGTAHGEAAALADAGSRARGATLYITLEPCAHHGRTPPCVDAVLNSGVREVVIGTRDPNPQVRGGGIELLRRAGVSVRTGVLKEECDDLIAAFRKLATTGLPYVTLKLAASLDGRIATVTGESRWITAEASRRFVHRLRNEHDAVLVGAETVIRDDPELTCRLAGGRNPLRVVVDGRLRLPPRARLIRDTTAAATLVITSSAAAANRRRQLQSKGVDVVVLPGSKARSPWRRILQSLGRRGLMSVLVEGGADVAAGVLSAGLVDSVYLFYAPKLIGGDGRPLIGPLGVRRLQKAIQLCSLKVQRLGDDLLVIARPSSPEAHGGSGRV